MAAAESGRGGAGARGSTTRLHTEINSGIPEGRTIVLSDFTSRTDTLQ